MMRSSLKASSLKVSALKKQEEMGNMQVGAAAANYVWRINLLGCPNDESWALAPIYSYS